MRRVVLKDESGRLGLPAFKALGVSYAIHRVICDRGGRTETPASFEELRKAAAQRPLELVTATDGNHGQALAHFARLLDVPVQVFVPDIVAADQIEAIRSEGAEVVVLPDNYDETVARAARAAELRPDAVLVQDTAWPGYEAIPQYIVDGYATMFAEVDEQLGEDAPTLMVTPMGVGSLAQAVITHCKSRPRPVAVLGVEPDTAACVRESVRAASPAASQPDRPSWPA